MIIFFRNERPLDEKSTHFLTVFHEKVIFVAFFAYNDF